MTKEQYDFIEFIKSCEMRDDSNSKETVVSMWIPFYKLEDFVELMGEDYFCESGEEVVLRYDSIYVNVLDYIEAIDIDEEIIFHIIEEMD